MRLRERKEDEARDEKDERGRADARVLGSSIATSFFLLNFRYNTLVQNMQATDWSWAIFFIIYCSIFIKYIYIYYSIFLRLPH